MNRTAPDKTRVYATVTREQCARVDSVAERMGISRSSAVAFLISSALESFEMFGRLSDDKMKIVLDSLKDVI